MNVYFEKNFWGCQGEDAGKEPGREIRLETGFTWKGRSWQIPAVYVCEEGLVMDLCKRIGPEEIRAFCEKWSARKGRPDEQERLEHENPFDMDLRIKAWVNEKEAPGQMGCGTSWCPPELRPDDEAVQADADPESDCDRVERRLLETYGLDPKAGWSFWRSSFAWPKGRPGDIHSLTFTFREMPVSVPGPHFWVEEQEAGQRIEFVHPATGRTHVLLVLGQETDSLSRREFPPEREIEGWPVHFQVLHYQVEPELSDREKMNVCDCMQSDSPICREQPAASSIAVIGGADGPTSIFFVGKKTDPDAQPHRRAVCSALHHTPQKKVEWKLVFQLEDEETKEVRVEL